MRMNACYLDWLNTIYQVLQTVIQITQLFGFVSISNAIFHFFHFSVGKWRVLFIVNFRKEKIVKQTHDLKWIAGWNESICWKKNKFGFFWNLTRGSISDTKKRFPTRMILIFGNEQIGRELVNRLYNSND